MSYRCANCANVFSESDAKCDNWLDDKRNLICPYCNVALMSVARAALPWRQRIKQINYQHLIWVAVFCGALVMIDRRAGLPYMFPFVASFMALVAVLFYGWVQSPGPDPTETVDIVLEKSGGDNVFEFKSRRH